MKSPEWKTYRTRFLVKAKQLTSTLSFTDHLGRQHCGRKGDYLVESFEGVLSIAPRHIFEDIYVSMSAQEPVTETKSESEILTASKFSGFSQIPIEPLKLEKIRKTRLHIPVNDPRHSDQFVSSRIRRKSPQPVRDSASRMGLM